MAKKFYAVKVGKKTGIYENWSECSENVIGVSGAIYKSFDSLIEAKNFLNENTETIAYKEDKLPKVYSFVDGSFNIKTNVYGYGGFLVIGDEKIILQGSDNDGEMASMRNVSGEILGAMASIDMALSHNQKEITIYYDYFGIEKWATGEWKANKKGTIEYKKYIENVKNRIKISFVKVKAHSKIEGNEEADRLAKQAVGI